MDNVVKVKAGWIKRLPDVVLGPFKTQKEAEEAYKTAEKVKNDYKKDKKFEVKSVEPKKVEDSFKAGE